VAHITKQGVKSAGLLAFTETTEGCGDRTGGKRRLGEETYGGAGLEHVRQVRLGVGRDQYDRSRCRAVDLVKSLREIEAAFFADIYVDQCYVGSQLPDGPASSTGTGQRRASVFSVGPRPPLDRIAG